MSKWVTGGRETGIQRGVHNRAGLRRGLVTLLVSPELPSTCCLADGGLLATSSLRVNRVGQFPVVFEPSRARKLVTELVSRHVVVTCFRVLSDLPTSGNPRFWPKNAM